MNWIDKIKEAARGTAEKYIVFPEGNDERIVKAAGIIAGEKIARPLLLTEKKIARIETLPGQDNPLKEACRLVAAGKCQGMVAGAAHKTADVIRSSLQYIGVKEGCSAVSSFFVMIPEDSNTKKSGTYLFADCAVIPRPSPAHLAEIAVQTARSSQEILGWTPRVALLSFSTKGSAEHNLVKKVQKAKTVLDAKKVDFLYDGELQLDAAIVPEVALKKDRKGILKGNANILIFPDLNSANIAYKITERLGNYHAVGPILQGFKKPVNDLSRGCRVRDIVNVTAVTVMQCRENRKMQDNGKIRKNDSVD